MEVVKEAVAVVEGPAGAVEPAVMMVSEEAAPKKTVDLVVVSE